MLTLADRIFPIESPEFVLLSACLMKGQVLLPPKPAHAGNGPGPLLAKALHSQITLEVLRHAYDQALVEHLSWLPAQAIATIHTNLFALLSRGLGAHRVFEPMYPDFPDQVLDASDQQLLCDAWTQYLGDWLGMRLLPAYRKGVRSPLSPRLLASLHPTILRPAPPDLPDTMATDLARSNASLSPDRRKVLLAWLQWKAAAAPEEFLHMLGTEWHLPQRETRALVCGWCLRHAPEHYTAAEMAHLADTATDVLRLAVAASSADLAGADLSLTEPAPFRSIPRRLRRQLMELLDGIASHHSEGMIEEMARRRERWLRLGEAIHPGQMQQRYPHAAALFGTLRNKQYPPRWAATVNRLLADGQTPALLPEFSRKPGIFARRLHEILTHLPDSQHEQILRAFANVAESVSTPVLLQMRQRMLNLAHGLTVRAFAPKTGGMLWVTTPEATSSLSRTAAEQAAEIATATLTRRFAALPCLGRVYIDPQLRHYTIPFAQRSAQKTLHTVARGSRLPLGDTPLMRVFLWWQEKGVDRQGKPYAIGRTDLDLSCAVLDEQFNALQHCSFTDLRSAGLTHSGDITSAPEGACEFIDIDFEQLPTGAHYLALLAYAYTPQKFADLPEAFLGWMGRDNGQQGEIFEARTVQQKVDLTASGQRLLVGYVDIAARELVWADLVLPGSDGYNAIESCTQMLRVLAPGILSPLRPTLHDLFTLHTKARGTRTDDREQADMIFSADLQAGSTENVLTPTDMERLMAGYLA